MTKLQNAIKAYQRNPAIKKGVSRPLTPAPAVPKKGVVRPGVTAGTTGAPGGPPANPMPWDANYESSVDAINANRDSTYATIDNQINAAKQAYGFDDLSNPFSKIALLKESFANANRGITNSMADQGQLYSGANENAHNAEQHSYDTNYDATRRSYDSVLGGLAARRTAAKNQALDDTAAAGFTRTQTALANRPDLATLPAPAPKAKSKKPPKKGR